MNKIAIGIIIVLIAGTSAIAGYYSGKQKTTTVASSITTSPEPTISEEPRPSESDRPEATDEPTRQPSHWVLGTSTVEPTPRPTPTPTPFIPALTDVYIQFVNTPTQVSSGQDFTVSWTISGIAGSTGTTSLQTQYNVSSEQGNSRSNVNTNNSQGFGSFTVPQTFSTNLKYSGSPGTIHVTATAEVNGKTVKATRDIELVD